MVDVRSQLKDLAKDARWAATRVRKTIRAKYSPLIRRLRAPTLPRESAGPLKLHLGCGDIDASGFVNIDMRPASHVHVVGDVADLSMFKSGTVDLVYACHVLEHFVVERQREVLWEWHRVLKSGGILRLSVPDFDLLLEIYEHCGKDVMSIVNPLFGDGSEYSPHRCIFNQAYLESALREVGFSTIRTWDPQGCVDHDFVDWASRTVYREGRQWPVSLNVEALR